MSGVSSCGQGGVRGGGEGGRAGGRLGWSKAHATVRHAAEQAPCAAHLVLHVPKLVRGGDLLRHDARNAEHGPPRVHALGLLEPREALLVGAQAERVKALQGT